MTTQTDYTGMYSPPFYMCMYILYSIGQGTAWPNLVSMMGSWFGDRRRGLIMGVWSNSQYIGNIVSSAVTAALLIYGYPVSAT